jgi:hypothetical protein
LGLPRNPAYAWGVGHAVLNDPGKLFEIIGTTIDITESIRRSARDSDHFGDCMFGHQLMD